MENKVVAVAIAEIFPAPAKHYRFASAM